MKKTKQSKKVEQNSVLSRWNYFVSPIYSIEAPQFLKDMSEVSDKYLEQAKKQQIIVDDLYPVCMTDNYFNDPKAEEFTRFVGQSAWNILDEQGYAMDDKVTYFTEMWTQEHHKMSNMEQHIHPNSHIVGFYFLDCPENCSKILIHDPRSGKVQTNLPQKNLEDLTDGSITVNFQPKEGLLMFAPSWLPHGFTRNGNDKPMKFVHFNVAVKDVVNMVCSAPAEVI